jgi:hypothetical protein
VGLSNARSFVLKRLEKIGKKVTKGVCLNKTYRQKPFKDKHAQVLIYLGKMGQSIGQLLRA